MAKNSCIHKWSDIGLIKLIVKRMMKLELNYKHASSHARSVKYFTLLSTTEVGAIAILGVHLSRN